MPPKCKTGSVTGGLNVTVRSAIRLRVLVAVINPLVLMPNCAAPFAAMSRPVPAVRIDVKLPIAGVPIAFSGAY